MSHPTRPGGLLTKDLLMLSTQREEPLPRAEAYKALINPECQLIDLQRGMSVTRTGTLQVHVISIFFFLDEAKLLI